MEIYCCGCNNNIDARLTNGVEIYPHRKDLHHLPFWKCDACGNYVGCHHKSNDPQKPLGIIPTPEVRIVRQRVHRLIDPIWQSGKIDRKALYKIFSDAIGREYHTAEIRSVRESQIVMSLANKSLNNRQA